MYHLDQSIRIEQTNKDTIIGLAHTNSKSSYTIIVPARVKRQIQEYYRRRGLPKLFMINCFTAGIILILKKSRLNVHHIVIDIEYPGYESHIQKALQVAAKSGLEVSFSVIGKHSPAHQAAYGVYIRKRQSDYKCTFTDLFTIIKEKDRGL